MRLQRHLISTLIVMVTLLWSGAALFGQSAVIVTVTADDTNLLEGETTTLRVFGQIAPDIEAQSLRIFSWYLDLLVEDGAGVLTVDWDSLTMTASDSPDGSGPSASDGTEDLGGNCRGIHNTFLLAPLPGPGLGAPVELLSVEVTATAQSGIAMIEVAPGTTVMSLANDFLVAKDGGGAGFTGGVYPGQLSIEVNPVVIPDPDSIDLTVVAEVGGARVQFTTEAGLNYQIDFSDNLLPGTWSQLPGAPHNSGDVLDASAVGIPERFYRVTIELP